MYMSESLTIKMQLDAAYISRNNYYVTILHQKHGCYLDCLWQGRYYL